MAKNKRTTVDKLADEIGDILEEYVDEITKDVNDAALVTGRQTRDTLRHAPTPKRTGKYQRSWDTKTTENPLNGLLTVTVYARSPYYRLTHLLENGHAKVNGGRVDGIEHIRPAEQTAIDEFVRLTKEAIERG